MWACVCVCSFFVVCATNGPKIDVHRNYIIPFPYPGLSDSVRGEKNRKNFFPFNFPKHQTTHQCVCVCVRLDFQLTSVTRNCSVPHRGEEQLFTNSFSQSRPRQSSIHCQNCCCRVSANIGSKFQPRQNLFLHRSRRCNECRLLRSVYSVENFSKHTHNFRKLYTLPT